MLSEKLFRARTFAAQPAFTHLEGELLAERCHFVAWISVTVAHIPRISQLPLVERKDQHRLIHSMKSSTSVVGAQDFSARLAQLEAKLAEPALPDLSPTEIQQLTGEFETIAGPLRNFVAP